MMSFCPHCGLEQVHCPKCHSVCSTDWGFCSSCGADLSPTATTEPPPQAKPAKPSKKNPYTKPASSTSYGSFGFVAEQEMLDLVATTLKSTGWGSRQLNDQLLKMALAKPEPLLVVELKNPVHHSFYCSRDLIEQLRVKVPKNKLSAALRGAMALVEEVSA